jgi:hypothetical protein
MHGVNLLLVSAATSLTQCFPGSLKPWMEVLFSAVAEVPTTQDI